MMDIPTLVSVHETESLKLVTDAAREYAEKHLGPFVMEWDETQHFPIEAIRVAGQLGFLGVIIPSEYGGSGMSYHEYIAILEQISIVDPSIGLSVAAHNSLCTNHIYLFGNEAQRCKWLPKLTSGEHIGAWGLTEHNTGSDAKGMSTTARKEGDYWILNGTKNFITHGKSGDIAVVIARNAEKGDNHGMTAFVVERGTPGFTAGKKEVRAWTVKVGATAPQAAGVIHTDFEKGFIRAEVMKYEDYISLGSETAVKEAGKMGVEGKEYIVQDGDIMHFRFNV